MQVRSDRVVRGNGDSASASRTVHLRDSVLSQLRQMGMSVEDDNVLADLNNLEGEELIAVLGLFGLLGYFALLGLFSTQRTDT